MHKHWTRFYRISHTTLLVFTRPKYTQSSITLSLTNAIPSLSTNIIDDDNISTFTISKLNSDQFTHSSNSNALSNSAPYTHRILLRSINIDPTECLKSWLLSNSTAWEELVATSLTSWQIKKESPRSHYQLHQAKDREVDNSGESRGERAAVFWSSTKA